MCLERRALAEDVSFAGGVMWTRIIDTLQIRVKRHWYILDYRVTSAARHVSLEAVDNILRQLGPNPLSISRRWKFFVSFLLKTDDAVLNRVSQDCWMDLHGPNRCVWRADHLCQVLDDAVFLLDGALQILHFEPEDVYLLFCAHWFIWLHRLVRPRATREWKLVMCPISQERVVL